MASLGLEGKTHGAHNDKGWLRLPPRLLSVRHISHTYAGVRVIGMLMVTTAGGGGGDMYALSPPPP
jgi:hypothetical protein